MNRITIDNFGENGYIAFREKEEHFFDTGRINDVIFHPFSGSKNPPNDEDDTLNRDFLTKFYIASLSFIGLYIFHNIIYS